MKHQVDATSLAEHERKAWHSAYFALTSLKKKVKKKKSESKPFSNKIESEKCPKNDKMQDAIFLLWH